MSSATFCDAHDPVSIPVCELRRFHEALIIAQAMLEPENRPPQFTVCEALHRIVPQIRRLDDLLDRE